MTDLAMIFRSLGNPVRLAIVRELATKEEVVPSRDILRGCAKASNLSQPTMSQHFAKLVAAGVLVEKRQGNEKFYSLNRDLLDESGIKIT